MKKFIAICVGVLIAGVALILVLAATKPDRFHVERSLVINASQEGLSSLKRISEAPDSSAHPRPQ